MDAVKQTWKKGVLNGLCALTVAVVFYVALLSALSAMQISANGQGSVELGLFIDSLIKPLLLLAAAMFFFVKGKMGEGVKWNVVLSLSGVYLVVATLPYVLSFWL